LVVRVGGAAERDGWRRRRSDEEEEEEPDEPIGPQLLSAIVSITCSSLLRSRCLLACSSRSNADKI